MNQRTMKKAMAVVLSAAMALSGIIVSDSGLAAAKKPSLAKTKGTITVGSSKTVKITGVTKKNVKKITAKSSNKKVATVKASGKTAIKITGKKAGKATITATVILKKAVKKKTKFKLTYKATVKKAVVPTAEPTEAPAATYSVTAFADLLSTLKEAQALATGAQVTLTTSEATAFEIPAADYSKVDLVVDAPNADITNAATFKSVTIKAIKASTWTEKGKGNSFTFLNTNPIRFVEDALAQISSITFKGTAAAKSTFEIAGALTKLLIGSKAPVDIKATGSAKIDEIDIAADAGGANANITANGQSTISKIKVEDPKSTTKITGDTKNAIDVQKVKDAKVDATGAPAAKVTDTNPSASASPSPTPTATASSAPSGGGSGSGGGGSSTTTIAVTGVTIDKTAPKVGDTISATVTGTNTSSATYKWYTCDTNSSTASDWTQVSTAKTLPVTDAMFGKYIKLIVSGTSTSKEAVTTSPVAAKEGNHTITVTQPTKGGTIAASANQAAEGTEITLTATPAKGYEFGSWSVTGASESDNKFTMASSDVTVEATFTAISYTMAYDSNDGGSAPTSETFNVESSFTFAGVGSMTKDGSVFVGWSLNPEATSATWIAGATITADEVLSALVPATGTEVTAYAVWQSAGTAATTIINQIKALKTTEQIGALTTTTACDTEKTNVQAAKAAYDAADASVKSLVDADTDVTALRSTATVDDYLTSLATACDTRKTAINRAADEAKMTASALAAEVANNADEDAIKTAVAAKANAIEDMNFTDWTVDTVTGDISGITEAGGTKTVSVKMKSSNAGESDGYDVANVVITFKATEQYTKRQADEEKMTAAALAATVANDADADAIKTAVAAKANAIESMNYTDWTVDTVTGDISGIEAAGDTKTVTVTMKSSNAGETNGYEVAGVTITFEASAAYVQGQKREADEAKMTASALAAEVANNADEDAIKTAVAAKANAIEDMNFTDWTVDTVTGDISEIAEAGETRTVTVTMKSANAGETTGFVVADVVITFSAAEAP